MTDLDPSVTSDFVRRHIGIDSAAEARMLEVLGYPSLDALMDAALPPGVRCSALPDLPEALSEAEALAQLRAMAAANPTGTPMIGLGYHTTITPPVIRRNVVENPSWYTAYTPDQPEISQGRLEALVTFQTMVTDLTGLDIANSSLLDEATAAAEAMTMMRRATRAGADRLLVDDDVLPQTLAVLITRAGPLGIEIETFDADAGLPDTDAFGVVLAYPGADGRVRDPRALIGTAHERKLLVCLTTDLLALALLESPGELGADIAVGSSQRFGVPLFLVFLFAQKQLVQGIATTGLK